jgi:rhodanese-related sulfurtransferase/plastocyanin
MRRPSIHSHPAPLTRLILASWAALAIPVLAAAEDPITEPRKPVPLVSPQRVVEMVRESPSRVVFVDVREPEEFAEGHIPGAINIREQDFAARIGEVPKDALVIPYCNMDFRGFVAVRSLEELGIERVALMQERGINGWREQGLPVAGPESGLSDEEALERLRSVETAGLLGDRYSPRVAPSGVSHEISMTAAEWYFEPNDLEVEAGDEVRLTIQSEQGDHFFIQPDFEVAASLPAGEAREVVFLADRPGDYRFGSCEWDGSVLQVMKGRLRVRAREK